MVSVLSRVRAYILQERDRAGSFFPGDREGARWLASVKARTHATGPVLRRAPSPAPGLLAAPPQPAHWKG